jgi:hypothetical protein
MQKGNTYQTTIEINVSISFYLRFIRTTCISRLNFGLYSFHSNYLRFVSVFQTIFVSFELPAYRISISVYIRFIRTTCISSLNFSLYSFHSNYLRFVSVFQTIFVSFKLPAYRIWIFIAMHPHVTNTPKASTLQHYLIATSSDRPVLVSMHTLNQAYRTDGPPSRMKPLSTLVDHGSSVSYDGSRRKSELTISPRLGISSV